MKRSFASLYALSLFVALPAFAQGNPELQSYQTIRKYLDWFDGRENVNWVRGPQLADVSENGIVQKKSVIVLRNLLSTCTIIGGKTWPVEEADDGAESKINFKCPGSDGKSAWASVRLVTDDDGGLIASVSVTITDHPLDLTPPESPWDPKFFRVAANYVDQLRGVGANPPVDGPQQIAVERRNGAAVAISNIPLARLKSMLLGCRKAGLGVRHKSRTNPNWVELDQSLECTRVGATEKSVFLIVTTSENGGTISSVTARLGEPVSWPPPVVTPPPEAYSDSEFDKNQKAAQAFLSALLVRNPIQGGVSRSRAIVTLATDADDASHAISFDRAREILIPCKQLSVSRGFHGKVSGAPRKVVTIIWRCDPKTSARADLVTWLMPTDGAINEMAMETMEGYDIQPGAVARVASK